MGSKGKHSFEPLRNELPNRKLCFGLAILFALTFQLSTLAASDSYKKGMQLYNKKDYKNALPVLGKAALEDPYNAELRYYLANTHMFLKNGDAAMKEYSQCFELEPLSTFGQYSRQALTAFGKKFRGFGKVSNDGKKHVAADDSKSIKQALALIKGQSCDRDTIHHGAAESAAKTAVAVGEERDHRLSKAAQDLVEDMAAANKHVSPAVQEEMHEIQQRAVFEGQRARLQAQQEAANHMTAAAMKSTHVETSASSLLSLISETPRPGHVKVKAAGTNLYVRNYDFEAAPPTEPLVASWELLPELQPAPRANPAAINLRSAQIVDVGSRDLHKTKPNLNASLKKKSSNPKSAITEKLPDAAVKSGEAVFVPGSSKVVVIDSSGKVLLHVREPSKK